MMCGNGVQHGLALGGGYFSRLRGRSGGVWRGRGRDSKSVER